MSRLIKELLILLTIIAIGVGSVTLVYQLVNKIPENPPVEEPGDPEHQHTQGKVTKKTLSESTCTDSGFYEEIVTCKCGEVISTTTKSTPPTGHKMNGNSCTKCDYLTVSEGFEFDTVDSYCIITGRGTNKDVNVIIPESYEGLPVGAIGNGVFANSDIQSIVIPDTVTTIGNGAFEGCEKLERVSLGDSVVFVGTGAFDGCTALEFAEYDNALYLGNEKNHYIALIGALNKDIVSCTIHENTKVIAGGAFEGCGLLRQITIPDRVKTIGERAFYDCTNLLSLTIGKSLENVMDDAFLYCHKLVEIYNLSDEFIVHKGVNANGHIGYYALDLYKTAGAQSKLSVDADGFVFYEGSESYLIAYHGDATDIELPTDAGSYVMYSHAFSNLKLNSVKVNAGLTSVGSYAFRNCEELTEVDLPAGLNRIESGAFEGCVKLGSISIPDSVNYVGSHAFEDCASLAAITLPAGVDRIDGYVFMNCVALEQVTLKGTATKVGEYAFYGCKALKSFNLNGAESIGDYAFYGCKAVSAADLSTVVTVGDYAFSGSGLTTLTVSPTVTSVGEQAFAGCTALTSLNVPNRTNSLSFGDGAFAGCTALESATIGNKVSTIPNGMFRGCVSLTDVSLSAATSKIGKQAFEGCATLRNINLNNIKSIGDQAFAECARLSDVDFSSALISIGARAFEKCYNLMGITIPKSVISIGENAFFDCVKLVEVYQLASSISGEEIAASRLTSYAIKVYYVDTYVSKITEVGDFIFYNSGSTKYLLGYDGASTALTLPENGSYDIYSYAFYRFGKLDSVSFGNAQVGGVGDYAFADCDSLTDVAMSAGVKAIGSHAFFGCDSLTSVSGTSGVKTVGSHAFSDCAKLAEIALGSSAQSIGAYAFANSGITSVNTGAASVIGEHAFDGCKELTVVIMDGPVSYLGDFSFNSCAKLSDVQIMSASNATVGVSAFAGTALNSIALPEGFVSVKDSAFKGCGSISTIALPTTLREIGKDAFLNTAPDHIIVAEGNSLYAAGYNCIFNVESKALILGSNNATIPADARFIEANAFAGCNTLAVIDLSTIVKVGENAFNGCVQLQSVSLGNNLISLGASAFKNCDALTEVALSGSLTNIGNNAFESCDSLTTVHFGEGIVSVGSKAFADCVALASVELHSGLTEIGASAFAGCESVATLLLPDGLKKIGNNAFENCKALTALLLPAGLETLGDSSFSGCSSVTEVEIGRGLAKIGKNAFKGCGAMKSITLTSSVTEIGANAFNGCNALKNVYFNGTKDEFKGISLGSGNSKFQEAKVNYIG